MDRVEKHAPWRDHENWRDGAFRTTPGFGPHQRVEFRHRQTITPEGVVPRVASVSHVVVLSEGSRRQVLDEVRAVLASHQAVAGREVVEMPYRVDCIAMQRIDDDHGGFPAAHPWGGDWSGGRITPPVLRAPRSTASGHASKDREMAGLYGLAGSHDCA